MPYLTGTLLIGEINESDNDGSLRAVSLGAGVVAMFAKNVGGFFELNYNFDHFSTTEEATSPWDEPDEIVYNGDRLMVQLGLRLLIW